MADSVSLGDLAAAVSDALRGDRAGLRGALADASRRAQDRVLDAFTPRAEDGTSAAPLPRAQRQPLPQPAPDRDVVIGLTNGRRVRARISPGVARRRDLMSLSRAIAENDRRAFAALDQHRDAILQLERSQEAIALDVAAAATPTTPVVAKPPREPIADVALLATRAQIQNVTNVVNSLQAVAYGQKGRLFATTNLLLAGSQLFWSLLDPMLERAGVLNAASATVMAAVAPLGSLLTGQILLGERQTARFISGLATFDGTNTVAFESLRGQVGEQLWPAFQRRTDVPVTLSVLDAGVRFAASFAAQVVGGTVRLSFEDRAIALPVTRVAWMVDTGAGVG